jgi:hypothetical protein
MLTKDGYKYLGGADEEVFTAGIDAQLAEMQGYNQIYTTFDDWVYASGEQKGQTVDWSTKTGDVTTLTNMANKDNVDWSLIGDGSYNKETLLKLAEDL